MKEKLRQWTGKLSGFVGEVKAEMIKSTWPTRAELMESTLVVVVTVALLSLFVVACDVVITNLVRFVVL